MCVAGGPRGVAGDERFCLHAHSELISSADAIMDPTRGAVNSYKQTNKQTSLELVGILLEFIGIRKNC